MQPIPIRPQLRLLTEPVPCSFRLQCAIEPLEGPVVERILTVRHVLVIGRGPSAHLRVQGQLVSRCHVLVRAAQGGGLEIEDVSSFGSLLDGTPLLLARARVGEACQLLVGCARIQLRRLFDEAPR